MPHIVNSGCSETLTKINSDGARVEQARGKETAKHPAPRNRTSKEIAAPIHNIFSAHRIEDAAQETLLHAWRYRDSIKEGAPWRPWLYRVATNACLESIFVVWFPASSETFQ